MGSCLDCFKKNDKKIIHSEAGSALIRAKQMTRTANGKIIVSKTTKKLVTRAELNKLCEETKYLKVVFQYALIDFTQIINDLFLTGTGGIVEENIKKYGIKCIINATFELPLLKVPGIESIRVPVEDEEYEQISIYFDDVSDQIDKWIRNKQKVVVHCMCGISRSTTLVLAYLIKYKAWDLKKSYEYVKEKRPRIEPNPSFFQQLITYEMRILKKTSVKMIDYTLKNGQKVKVPDIILRQYPEETEKEGYGRSLDSTLSDSIFSSDTTKKYFF